MISDCLKGFDDTIQKQGVTLGREIFDNPPQAEASAAALIQVFNVLIDNALQAMAGGEQLSIVEKVSLDGSKLEISLFDTGHGISEANIEKVFKLFYTSKSGGGGVGLALAKRIVERFKGNLDISSVENQGTTATVCLPVAI